MADFFLEFGEYYKWTNPRISANSKHEKHKEKYSKSHNNQID